MLTKVIGAGRAVYTLFLSFPTGLLVVCCACFYTEFPVSASHSSRLARKTCHLTKALCFTRTLVRWLWRAWRVWRSNGGQSSQRPGRLSYFKWRRGPNNEHYDSYVLKGLGDSEVAQQVEESPTSSQMARVERRGWRPGGRMECNCRRSKVCRIDVCDRLVYVGCS